MNPTAATLPEIRPETLLDSLPAAVALVGAGGRLLYTNAEWRQLPGIDAAGDGLAAAAHALCDAESLAELRQAVEAVQAGSRARVQLRLQPPAAAPHAPWQAVIAPQPAAGATAATVLLTALPALPAAESVDAQRIAAYRSIFGNSGVPMWLYDAATRRFLAVNDAAVARYGYSRAEFLAMTIEQIRPPADVPALLARLACDDRMAPPPGVWTHVTKGGALMRVEVHAHPMEIAGTRVRLVMAFDVTERLAAEEALRESEQRFRQLTESISEVFWLRDEQRMLYVSPAYEAIWGRRCEDLYAHTWQWLDAVHPEDRARVAAAVHAEPDGRFAVEYRVVRPDGSVRWVADCAFPVQGGPDPAVRVAGVARDITAQHAGQARLQLLETALEHLSEMVVITDAGAASGEGPRIVYVNGRFERCTGYLRAEVLGRPPRFLQGPATQRDELDRIRAALERAEPVRAELINYRKSGEPYWMELAIMPIVDAAGRPTHFVAIERDLTERKQQEQKALQSQRLESLGQLTGGVAHDFNNLLTVMLGNAELLVEQLPPDTLDLRLARMIVDAAQRGADLTQRLLAFARRQVLEPRLVDVNPLLRGMEALLRRAIGEQVEVRLVLGPAPGTTLVDPAQLETALLNLAINARDAMPDGGRLTIETGSATLDAAYAARHAEVEPGEYVVIAVSDSGVGIGPDVLKHVFEPFFTTKPRGKGTGLGLAMVYGFVKQSAGHVAIYSEPGQGTTVRIYLRQQQGAAAAAAGPAADAREGGGELVLLVEDDALVRDYAHWQLQALGYRVLEAADGPQALALLRTRPEIDLLFTDVVMPGGMSGRELAVAAAALRPDLPVLYTSGYSESALTHGGRLDAGVRLLGKPYRRAELAAKLREALQDARAPLTPEH